GGGREQKTDIIDNSVGVHMKTALGDFVEKGQNIVDIYHQTKGLDTAIYLIDNAFVITKDKPAPYKIAEAYVDIKGVCRY
ncbi:MAG: hypothetical protein RR327_06820, partial [Clostridia bacterium]